MARQDRRDRKRLQLMVLDEDASFNDQRAYAGWRTQQQGSDSVAGTAIATGAQVEQRHVGTLVGFEAAEVAAAKAARALDRSHAQRLSDAKRLGAVCEPMQKKSLAGLGQQVRAVVRSAAIHPQAHGTARAAQGKNRSSART